MLQDENNSREETIEPGSAESRSQIDLNKYDQKFDGPSLKELNFGLWLSQKRKQIRHWAVIILIAISVSLFAYSVYNFIIYFKTGQTSLDNSKVPQSPKQLVSALQVGSVQVFQNSNSSDLVVQLTNPNDKFSASFHYCFSQAGQDLACGDSFILPREQKYIFDLAQKLPQSGSIVVAISSLAWKRIDAHTIPDWVSYYRSHINFPVTGLNFQPIGSNSSKPHLNTLDFSIQNNSPYSYYEVPLNILFFRGQSLIGVQRYFLDNFNSGNSSQVSLSWPDNLSGVTNTEIQPDLNILNNSIYAPYTGQ